MVPRTIIALYDSRVTPNEQASVIAHQAEMPLNYLGLVVEPHDIQKGLPDIANRPDVRGVITWWQREGLPHPERYLAWASNLVDHGKRFVILGSLGFLQDASGEPTDLDSIDAFLRRLGLRFVPNSFDASYTARAVVKVPDMVEYERKLPIGLVVSEAVRRISPSVHVYLKARWANGAPIDLVVAGPQGGYVASGYAYYEYRNTDFNQWYLNPFAFFRKVFATDVVPKPDVTTLSGRRIYFSQMDGDGWRNATHIPSFEKKGMSSIDVLIDEIYKKFPDLPVSVSAIAADLDPAWCGDAMARKAARRVFALPQVEPASHTYTHPFDWAYYQHGTPAGEKIGVLNCHGKKGAAEAPRAYAKMPFDLRQEIGGSARYIDRFTPPGKKVRLLQWSGGATPFAAAVGMAARDGLMAINGGDTRLDAEFPSNTFVSPIGRWVDGKWQIYAAASNEEAYTDLWTRDFYGFRNLVQTLERTESPRRLKPIDVYYHAYSGERLASVNALLHDLRYVKKQQIVPIWTSTYAAIAQGFYTTRLTKLADMRWRVESRGALQTIRFDRAEKLTVDLNASEGVLGWHRYQGSLYVSLDSSEHQAVIGLKNRTSSHPVESARPILVQSRWLIDRLNVDGDGFGFDTKGFGPGEMEWSVRPGRYFIHYRGSNGTFGEVMAASGNGKLEFKVPASGPVRGHVEIKKVGEQDALQ